MSDELSDDYLNRACQSFFGPLAKQPKRLNWDLVYDKDPDDDKAVDEVMKLVFDASLTGEYELLDDTWRAADVSRLSSTTMVTFLCMTCTQSRDLYKERAGFVLRCKQELVKRGDDIKRITDLFRGLE